MITSRNKFDLLTIPPPHTPFLCTEIVTNTGTPQTNNASLAVPDHQEGRTNQEEDGSLDQEEEGANQDEDKSLAEEEEETNEGTNQGEDSSLAQEKEGDEESTASISPQDSLATLLRVPSRVYQASKEFYIGKFEVASDDAKRLWFFLHSQATKAILSKRDQVEIHEGPREVTKETLMQKVTVSDEAMVLMIIVAKLEEAIHETGNGGHISELDSITAGTTAPDQQENESEDSSTIGTRKRPQKQRGGRKKRVRGSSNANAIGADPEVGNNETLYNSFIGLIKAARESDELGWYDAAVARINEARVETRELSKALCSIETNPIMNLNDLIATQDPANKDPYGGLELCPIAEKILEQERQQAIRYGLVPV